MLDMCAFSVKVVACLHANLFASARQRARMPCALPLFLTCHDVGVASAACQLDR